MRIDQTLSELPCLRKSGHRVHRSNPDPPICRLLVSSIHLSLSCCAAFAAGKNFAARSCAAFSTDGGISAQIIKTTISAVPRNRHRYRWQTENKNKHSCGSQGREHDVEDTVSPTICSRDRCGVGRSHERTVRPDCPCSG
jgi:hypothetical protein